MLKSFVGISEFGLIPSCTDFPFGIKSGPIGSFFLLKNLFFILLNNDTVSLPLLTKALNTYIFLPTLSETIYYSISLLRFIKISFIILTAFSGYPISSYGIE